MQAAARCPTCESDTEPRPLLEKHGCTLHRCGACDHIFVHPLPDDGALTRLYSAASGYMARAPAEVRGPVPPKFRQRIDSLREHREGGRLLDVGCAFGLMLRAADEAGFEAVGVEMNPDTAALARGLGFEVHQGALDEAGFEAESFDVVHMGDLIEHVRDPFAVLSEARRVLRSDGLLLLSTPNHAAFFPRATRAYGRLLGVPWSHPTPPAHLHQFSLQSLERLFTRVGFRTLTTRFAPIRLGYEIRATGSPTQLLRALREHHPVAALRHGLASGLAVVGYSALAAAERLLPRDRPRADMTVTAGIAVGD